ncbi:hypothetical protein V3C99_019233, partial [Haemonchus contortus]|uniref:Sterile alpha motif and leucine zipper containing kinase AZK n=1 Tax=Haemonchus contortus TaxID=6289 RepID=A0A7I5EDS9_HAECO
VGDGILLPYTQPNFSWEEVRRYRRRAKRGSSSIKAKDDIKKISHRLLKYGPKTETALVTRSPSESTSQVDATSSVIRNESYEEM